jgi:RNA polymerase sigma factor (sigma-70 family)
MATKRTQATDRPDIPAFSWFLEEHRTAVYAFLRASLGPNDVDDCFQETFLAALRAYPDLRDASNLRGWIFAIASRKAIDAARLRARRPMAVGSPVEAAEAGPDSERRREGEDAPPEAAVLGDEELWRAVRALPDRQREAVVHRFVLDRPYVEIAAAMGGTEEAARANVHQGLKRLRREWVDDGDE